jgi:hypothetical protein
MSSTFAASDSMIASYDVICNSSSKNNDFEFASPVFYLPPVMPLHSGSVYAPFETDENGSTQYPIREYAADYSYDNHDWQSQLQLGGYSHQQQQQQFSSSMLLNDELPMSPTDSLTTSSSEEDQDMMFVDRQDSTVVADATFSPLPHSCFSSIAGFALKGYF